MADYIIKKGDVFAESEATKVFFRRTFNSFFLVVATKNAEGEIVNSENIEEPYLVWFFAFSDQPSEQVSSFPRLSSYVKGHYRRIN